ncbi:hypothetical protein YPPY19_3212, partial [Yersinia pestis PY-19]
MLFTDARQMSK